MGASRDIEHRWPLSLTRVGSFRGWPERILSAYLHTAYRGRQVGNVGLERVTDPPGIFE
jgi:hypothetical protein